jgi:hypothetical protein
LVNSQAADDLRDPSFRQQNLAKHGSPEYPNYESFPAFAAGCEPTTMHAPKKHSRYASLGGWLLLIAVLIGSVIEGQVAVVFEHAHADGHHHHDHHESFAEDSHGDSHGDHESHSPHEEWPEENQSHHHHLTFSDPPLWADLEMPREATQPANSRRELISTSESSPDGPFFDLIKPPQIG